MTNNEQSKPWSLLSHIGGKCPSCGGVDIRKSTRHSADLLAACATVDELSDDVVAGVACDNGYDESADEFRRIWKDKLADHDDQKPQILRERKEAVAYRCMNPHCPAQLAAKIQHLCSRKCLDIEGIGEEAADALAKRIYDDACGNTATDGARWPTPLEMVISVVTAPDLDWHARFLATLNWQTESGGTMTFGESRAKKAVAAIERAKKLPLHRWLFALGIPSVGENTSKEISRLCFDTDGVRVRCMENGLFTRIAAGESKDGELSKFQVSQHIGVVSAKALCDFMSGPDSTLMTVDLWRMGIQSDNYNPIPVKVDTGSALNGKTVVITGTLSVTRDEMKALLEKAGAKVGGSVSAKTDFLVIGEKAGGKADKAAKLGVKVLTEAEARAIL